jgi:CheY-like chemotaxis protein
MPQDSKYKINELLELLKSRERFAYIGQIMPEILHNISNHISVLHLNLEDIEDQLYEKGIHDKYIAKKLKKQKSAILKITDIVKELQTYVRRNQEQTDIISLNKLLDNCINIYKPIFQKENIELSVTNKEQIAILKGENGKLQHVFMNILSSSRNFFTPEEGGTIKIHSEIKDNKTMIDFALYRSDTEPQKEADTPDHCVEISQDKDKFVTAEFVKDLGGKLVVLNETQTSKNFKLTLPIISEMVADKTVKPDTVAVEKMSGRILVVDDEVDMLNIMKRYLTKLGFEVDIAVDGFEGLEYLKNKSYRFLMSDIKMPRMSGETMIQKARELNLLDNTKILVITGCFINQFADESGRPLRDGVDGYVYKPFSKDAILDILKKFDD